MATRKALWTLIGVSTLLRLIWGVSLGAFNNESYYYLYAHHLDWCFFDHPPMVGLVAALGLKLAGGASLVLGLRVGFIVLFAGSSWLLASLTTRSFGPRAGFLAALALNSTIFYGVIVGTFAGPDGPLLFFWLLTLDRLIVALESPGRTSAWVGVGLAWGAAMLSKYHAALLPVGTLLFLLLRPSARRCLRTPGPYLAAAIGILLFLPVVVWNWKHEWISFAYQGHRAGGFEGFRPEMFLEALIGQILYLTPWIWLGLVVVLVRLGRRGVREWDDVETLLVCQAAPALGVFLGVATFQRIMPHWPLIGFVALLPMLGRYWSDRLNDYPVVVRRRLAAVTLAPAAFAFGFLVQADTGLFMDARGLLFGRFALEADPTIDTIRWGQIAREIDRRGLLDDPRTFLFTNSWRNSAELAMAMQRPWAVACFHRDARSFTYWSRHDDWVGRDGIFVKLEDGEVDVDVYAPWFERIEALEGFPIVRAGVPVQTVRLYRCVRQTGPFLFGRNQWGIEHRPPSRPKREVPTRSSEPNPDAPRRQLAMSRTAGR